MLQSIKSFRREGVGKKDRSEWNENVLADVLLHIKTRRYKITRHVEEHQEEYDITLPDLLHALSNGYHEKEKTTFSNEHQSWKYAIRGWTIDRKKDLRVIVSFAEEMVLITIVWINKKTRKK